MSWDKTDKTLWDIVGPTTMDDLDERGYVVVKKRHNDALLIREAFFNYLREDFEADRGLKPSDEYLNRVVDDQVQKVLEAGIGVRTMNQAFVDVFMEEGVTEGHKKIAEEYGKYIGEKTGSAGSISMGCAVTEEFCKVCEGAEPEFVPDPEKPGTVMLNMIYPLKRIKQDLLQDNAVSDWQKAVHGDDDFGGEEENEQDPELVLAIENRDHQINDMVALLFQVGRVLECPEDESLFEWSKKIMDKLRQNEEREPEVDHDPVLTSRIENERKRQERECSGCGDDRDPDVPSDPYR